MTRPALLLLFALLSCAPPTPRPAVAPRAVSRMPELSATATASRVVLLFDNAAARDIETLVQAARRQGKRVGAVPSRTTADFGLAWTEPVVQGRTILLKREDFKREWVPPGWTAPPQKRQSFSPVMRARVEWAVPEQARIDVDLVAYDRTDDQVENYDALYLESGDFESSPDAQGWFSISMRTRDGLHGSWSKLVRADARLNEVEIYWGPISRNRAYPGSFLALIDDEAGFWPGTPDDRLDPLTFSEQRARMSQYLTRVQTLAVQRMPFDLLLLAQPPNDEAAIAIAKLLDPARDALVVARDRVVHATGAAVPKGEIAETQIADLLATLLGIEALAKAE